MNVALLLTRPARDEATITAVRLAERLLSRGHRVAVFAHEDAATLSDLDGDAGEAVAALVRAGLHGGTLDWVVDADAAARTSAQAPGVLPGDHGDLWALVRAADVVLSPGGA